MNVFQFGECIDFMDDPHYPCKAWLSDSIFSMEYRPSAAFYFYAIGPCSFWDESIESWRSVAPGGYFCRNDRVTVRGSCLAIMRPGIRGLPMLGGPIEQTGRLKYIDGCSDTLLIPPPRMGDPCLNHLHFPPNIKQTMHTHPTVRIGVVTSGAGLCVTPTGVEALEFGYGWYLPVDDAHCFHTGTTDTLDVIAWHPDTDTGPRDDDHPMLNRTYVEGVSAKEIDTIRTK